VKISLSTAQKLAIAGQGLDGGWKLPAGKEGVARAVEKLGYVQIDTIAVVERAHHHTLWARRADYRPDMLHQLQAEDRRVFEYWSPAASYLPMRDYRYSIPGMRGRARSGRAKRFLDGNRKLVRHVLDRIRAEGPLASADFAAPAGKKRGSWWDWKPAKQALEMLFNTGELMVTERRNFQRLYDLTERVLPDWVDTTVPPADEAMRARVRRILATQGVSALTGWWLGNREGVDRAARELVEAGEATPVTIAGLDGPRPYYARIESLESVRRRRSRPKVHILSPFDNLVIRRGPLRLLFDFDYKLECYTPAVRRKHGYFCLPILWGRRFIGRLDPKAQRKERTLVVRKLTFEPGFTEYDRVASNLAAKLRAYAAFNGCDRTVITETRPRKARAILNRQLRA
jgi:uncharacterized protein YcaQ